MTSLEDTITMLEGVHKAMSDDLPKVFPKEYRQGFIAAVQEVKKLVSTQA